MDNRHFKSKGGIQGGKSGLELSSHQRIQNMKQLRMVQREPTPKLMSNFESTCKHPSSQEDEHNPSASGGSSQPARYSIAKIDSGRQFVA